tara:strand:- start:2805 stop:3599 length:795 start_codon:yes stop_codon:yes gene_type:complete
MINKMTDLITDLNEIHAIALLKNVSYLNNDSFLNLIFCWLKLVYKNKPKKKTEFIALLAEFRDSKISKYVFDRQNGSFSEQEMKFIALATTNVSTKTELESVSKEMAAFRSVLEPFPGGYFKEIPTIVIYSVDKPEKILPYFQQTPLAYGNVQNKMKIDITALYTDFVQLCDNKDPNAYQGAWNNCLENKSEAFADEMTGLRKERDLLVSNVSALQGQLSFLKGEMDRVLQKKYCENQQHRLQLQEAYRHGQLSCHGYDLRNFR